MTAETLPEVMAVERVCFDDPWPQEVFEAELRHSWSTCLVLREDDSRRAIGHMVYWNVADEVHLLNIAVHPDARQHHHGTDLITHLMRFARTARARFITVEVRETNEAAMALYAGNGFKRVGMRPKYYASNGEDAIIMLCDMGSHTGQFTVPSRSD